MNRNPQTLEAVKQANDGLARIVASVQGVVRAADIERRETVEAAALANGWTTDEIEAAK